MASADELGLGRQGVKTLLSTMCFACKVSKVKQTVSSAEETEGPKSSD